MARAPSLEAARRTFAEELRVVSHIGADRVVEAFAAVPRERFAGPGPWRLLHDGDGYWSTPDANPHWLYHNVLIALDEKRRLNIGGPSLWAFHFDRIGVQEGDRVLQLGAGSGYTVSSSEGSSSTQQTGVSVSASSTTNVTLAIPVGSVQVTVDAGSSALAGATVNLTGPSGYTAAAGTTNGSGIYTFANVPVGSGFTASTTGGAGTAVKTGLSVTAGFTVML